jgi:uncharacterized membrane protein YdjX (TVP38/TMEM64 family)
MARAFQIRLAAAAALAVVVLGGTVIAGAGLSDLAGGVQATLRWGQALRGVGWIAFAALQIVIVASGVLPASLAGIAAGAVYGVPLGFGLAAASTMAGALVTLAISRSLARQWVERFIRRRPRLRDLDRMLAQDGARLVCLLRLSPVMPFAATSYALGLSSVSIRDYVIGTCASLPALLGYVFLGSIAAAGLASREAGWLHWGMLAVGAVATIGLTLRIGQLLSRARLVPPSMRDAVSVALRRPRLAEDALTGSDTKSR